MRVLAANEIEEIALMPELIEALRSAFCAAPKAPPRQILRVPGGSGERLLLFMPAFHQDGSGIVKVVTSFPDNAAGTAPTLQGAILAFSKEGTPVALLDGAMVTRLRTAAASALASNYLSRANSEHLLLVGTGALAPYMALGHCAVRPIRCISIWGRDAERAARAATKLRGLLHREVELRLVPSIESAMQTAQIVSCATSSAAPLLEGKWLRPGTFVDLVGSFSPERRETDDDAVLKSRIFVDTIEGALAEAGDVLIPMQRGILQRQHIQGDLTDLITGRCQGRRSEYEITLFKSVGTAIEDLAAVRLIVAATGILRPR